MVSGDCLTAEAVLAGLQRGERAVLVGARDLDPAEAEFLASSKVRRCPVDDVVLLTARSSCTSTWT